MNLKDYFILGCKLLGVYCIILSIPHLFYAITTFFPVQSVGPEFEKILFFEKLITRILPAVYIFIGVALIKNSEQIFSYAYSSQPEDDIGLPREKFRLFLKMLGMYLIANYLPPMIKSITAYFTYSNAPEVFSLLTQRQYTSTNFLPSLVAIVFGIYLLKSGNFFIHLGFRQSPEKL